MNFELHDWQKFYLCKTLQRLVTETGVRMLVHAPPQFGKSICTSKRFPAWALGINPLTRIILAGYNVEHSTTQFAEPVRDLMMSDLYAEIFPDPLTRIAEPSTVGAFSTIARAELNDGQDSVTAVGLLSGFTGKGLGPGDILIIDDPYASVEAANSKTINEKVWRWWHDLVEPRLHPLANVLVMFHRYHEDDLAGRLLQMSHPIKSPALISFASNSS